MLIQRYNIGGAPLVNFGTISTSCALFGSIMYTFARKRMQQNTDMVQSATPDGSVSDMVQSATPDGSVSESRRLDKSTDTTPLAYVVESLTRRSRILNLVQPSA